MGKKTIITATLLFATAHIFAADHITVIDASDKSAIIGATVFSQSGTIIGITDVDGRIGGLSPKAFPLTVKCLGYTPAIVGAEAGTVSMTAAEYPLSEVTVTPYDRPVMRVVCYMREYTSGATPIDTTQYYNEHMADFYIPVAKVKKFKARTTPRILTSRVYERYANSEGVDSVSIPKYLRDDISWTQLLSLPAEKFEEPDDIRAGATYCATDGKHGRAIIHRKNSQTYTTNIDYLADKKDHVYSPAFLKLIGFTIDITEMRGSWAYRANETGIYHPSDLLYGTFALDITGKGRWIKKYYKSDEPVNLHAFYEIYPVSMEYLTVEEAKKQQEHAPRVKFEKSDLAGPLPPAIESIVTRAKAWKERQVSKK